MGSSIATGGPAKARAAIALIYLLAAATAAAIISFTGFLHPLISTFCGLVSATLIIYLFSRLSANASIFDPSWSVAPLAITLFWFFNLVPSGQVQARQVLVIGLVAAWSVRLTLNWASCWKGLGHEDWRYTYLRRQSGKYFWLVELAGIEMMPMIVVYLGTLCVYPVMSTGTPLNIIDMAGLVVAVFAISIEGLADFQLRSFLHRSGRFEVMDHGLWAVSRHPNYLGEILFWWGLFLFVLATGSGYWWTLAGPAAVTLLFTVVSIPMMEKRNLARKRGYDAYQARVGALVPHTGLFKSGFLRLIKLR